MIKRAEDYLKSNLYINYSTGEFCDNYPTSFKDSQKAREEKATKILSKPNSYLNRLFDTLGEDAYWYTVNLSDIYPSWGKYESAFDPKKMKSIKKHFNRYIKGPYSATLELSAFTGAHVHLICKNQDYKHLKAEGKVYGEFGLVKYISKSSFAPKDKYDNLEEYKVMLGTYLH